MKHLKNLKESIGLPNFDKSQEMIYDLEDMALELIQDHDIKVDVIPEFFKDGEVVRYLIAMKFKYEKLDQYITFLKSVYSISKSNRYTMLIKIKTKGISGSLENINLPINSIKSVDNLFKNRRLTIWKDDRLIKNIFDFKIELTKYKKVEKGIVAKRKKLNDIFNSDEFGLLKNENTNMKHLKRFNENFSDQEDIRQEILDIFQPISDGYGNVSVHSGSGGKSNHIAIEVVSEDTENGFLASEKEALKDVLKHFENWLSYNEFEIVGENETDVSHIELVNSETVCPECGSYDIDGSGYDYDSGKMSSECRDCEYSSSDEDFEDRYINFYDFEKLSNILFEENPFHKTMFVTLTSDLTKTCIQQAIAFNIVIKV